MVCLWCGSADHPVPLQLEMNLEDQCDNVSTESSKHQDLSSIEPGSIRLLVDMVSLTLQATVEKRLSQHSTTLGPNLCTQRTPAW
jgi:hypothetical protein